MAKPILYRPPSPRLIWAAFGCTAVIFGGAVVAAIKHEAPPVDLNDIPTATVEASIEQAPEEQPTPPPEDIPIPEPPPMPPEIPEFHEETTPPPKQQPKTKPSTPIKTPQTGLTGPPKTMSISGAKALAISAPRPEYPYEARSRHIMGSGVCVVSVDMATGSVTDASMAQSIGNPILDGAAASAFRRWRFKPGTVSKVKIPITFTMAGASY